MDIKQLNSSLYSGRSNENNTKSTKDASVEASNAQVGNNGSTDKVTLTQNLSQIAELEQKAQGVSSDNSERIAALKAAINQGEYKVDSQKVAEKFLQSEQLLAQL